MKKRFSAILLLICAITGLLPLSHPSAHAQSIASQTSGYIVLDVENAGAAWYIDPTINERTSLGLPDDAYAIMREKGLGITTADLEKIPEANSTGSGDTSLRTRLSGRILLQVESHGEAWYVYPKTQTRYYLGRAADAFAIMSSLGLGISADDLAQISIEGSTSSIATSSSSTDVGGATHESITIATDRGDFAIELIRIPKNGYEMITDTAETSDCASNCSAQPLADYVGQNGGSIGIHGSYFCPPDYSSCNGKENTFDPPVWNSAAEVMLNEGDLPYHPGPLFTYQTDGTYYQHHRSSQFDTADEDHLAAAIGNYPSLVEAGENIIATESINSSQQTDSARGGIGFTDDEVLLVIAKSASVTDLASIFTALEADYAMNLDGGATAAMYFNGAYVYGPNREFANAIIFKKK